MTDLNIRTGIKVIWYADLEDFVKKTYSNDISILEMEEANQNSYVEVTVDGESEMSYVGDEDILAEWLATGHHPYLRTSMVLHQLFVDAHIEPGTYIVTMYW